METLSIPSKDKPLRKFMEFGLPALLSVVLFGITVFFFLLPRIETVIMANKQTILREMVGSFKYILDTYQGDVESDRIDLAEAQKRALRRLQPSRFGIEMKNYFWICDTKGRLLMHPIRADLVGHDLEMLPDPLARRVLQDVIHQAIRQKSGFIEYRWRERPDDKESHPKTAYISLFEPWGWIVGSSLYSDDAKKEIATLTRDLTFLGIVVLVIVTLLSGHLAWRAMLIMREREKAETALQQSELRFRQLFMMAPMPLAEMSHDETVIQVNEQFKNVLGYGVTSKWSMARWWQKAYPDPEYRESVTARWQTAVERALKENDLVEADEYRVMCGDGKERIMLIGASIIEGKLLVSFLDISDRKRAETARLENMELLRATLNATPDGILVVDENHRVIQVNRQFFEMWRIPEAFWQETDDDAILEYIKDQVKDWDRFHAKVKALYRSHDTDLSEIRFKDGRVFARYTCPMILGGREIGRVWEFRDITSQKCAESDREKLQEQLLQSQKLEAVGILAGGVAHDFNNMLGAIIGYAELGLGKTDSAESADKYFGRILDAAQRSATLTRQLLAFARKQTATPVIFDINTSVASMLEMLYRLIGENIELVWQPADVPCTVKMDPGQLDQVMVNLCVNAKDAIADVGRITINTGMVNFDEITCSACVDCVPGDYVQLTVSDDGSGMDNETMAHVFEPFFTTKGLGQGTGLGLSTVYGIVKQNNGFIKLYSERQVGSTFNICFPYHPTDAAENIYQPNRDVAESRGETILLVEDDPMLKEMGEIMLKNLGYAFLSAATPSEAIELAQENRDRIQLFVTDVIMPEMNGPELSSRLQTIIPQVKHIYMSGYTANIIAHQGIIDDNVNFIQKPFSIKALGEKIREVLDT